MIKATLSLVAVSFVFAITTIAFLTKEYVINVK